MSKARDLTGQRFGRLIAIKRVEDYVYSSGYKEVQWLCKCDCGNEIIVRSKNLTKKKSTQSCGCLQIDNVRKYNLYDLSGDYGIGYLSNGEKFLFDLEYYDLIKDYYWHKNNRGYITSNTKGKFIKLYRLILNCFDSRKTIDHINHNKLDNRKCNLRFVNRSQNGMNSKLHKNNTSGVSGVHYNKERQKWIVRIVINGERVVLGEYCDFESAKEKRLEAENIYYGEYSYNNSMNIGGN